MSEVVETRVPEENAAGARTRPVLILTREDEVDDPLARKAAALGFRVERVQLLATEQGTDSPALAERLGKALTPGTALAWTSRRAAEELSRVAPELSDRLRSASLYALGAESAAPARRAGLTVHTAAEARGAAFLAAHIAGRAALDGIRRVVFLHGDRALPNFAEGLEDLGLELAGALEVYRTRFLSPDLGVIREAVRVGGPLAVAFFSPSGAEALERALGEADSRALRERGTAIARGPTTFAALEGRGYRRAVYPKEEAAFEPFALETLRRIERNST